LFLPAFLDIYMLVDSTKRNNFRVIADMRWPAKTGIGNVMAAMLERHPDHIDIYNLKFSTAIGSPFSPLALSCELYRHARDGDVFWSPGFIPPLWTSVPKVVTVHDLTHLYFYSRAHEFYYNNFLKYLYRRCEAVVCVSDYTRTEFIRWSGMPRERVHVVLNGVNPTFGLNSKTLSLPFRYVLYPGNHRAYKNLERLIVAYARSSLPRIGIDLLLTGSSNDELVAVAKVEGVERNLRFAGRLEDADLPRIYKGAEAVAFVSLYEGFGLPIVEAMASGVPVVTSNVSSMPEVAGDAALIVDPYSVEAISRALDCVITDKALREMLIGHGYERVKHFDWGVSAKQLWDIVDRVAEVGPVVS